MQITKAMELVATSKLRHAKERAEGAKPYMDILSEAISVIGGTAVLKELAPPVSEGKTLYVVIAGDRGLAGGYNNNIFKLSSALDKKSDGVYLPIGKKSAEYFARRSRELFAEGYFQVADMGVGDCFKLADKIFSAYLAGEISSVKLLYTKFVSMMTQSPIYEDILPLPESAENVKREPIFEGDATEIFESIMPGYIGGLIYAAVCESVASECASRRMAMNSANKNAEEMIETLMLKFNRARQAVITQEITEIVSGSEAL